MVSLTLLELVMKRSALTPKTLRISFFIFALLFTLPAALFADSYSQNLKFDLKRGLKNVLTSPLEIPIGIQDYHERAGWPVVRQTAGAFAGAGKMILRLGSGLLDFGAAWLPGMQKGLPPDPEVLL